MSYDFQLLPRSLGSDLLAHAHADDHEGEINPGPPTPEGEDRKARLSRALATSNPMLTQFAFGFAEIAKTRGITEAEARVQFRHVELNGPEGGNGIQLTLFDNAASITVPYWHQGAQAAIVVDEIWRYLDVLEREGHFATFDPQLDKILDLVKDKPAVLAAYARVIERMPQIVAQATRRAKPWWQFW